MDPETEEAHDNSDTAVANSAKLQQIMPSDVSDEKKEECEHCCFMVLQTQRKVVKNKAFPVDLMTKIIKLDLAAYMPNSMVNDLSILH